MNFQIRKNCCPEFATQDLCFDKNLLFGYPLFMLLMIMEKVRSYKLRTAVLLLFEHTKDSVGPCHFYYLSILRIAWGLIDYGGSP